MIVENLIFWAFALMAVSAALGVVFHRSIIYSALFLIVVFLSIAGFFILNNADFLAVAQTIVYAVGLTIILLFGVMLTGDRLFDDGAVTHKQLMAYLVIGAFSMGLLMPAAFFAYSPSLATHNFMQTPSAYGNLVDTFATEGSTRMLGEAIFTTYALPFEVASVLLLLAMIGAILLSKKSFTEEDTDQVKYHLSDSALPPEAAEALKKSAAGSLPPEVAGEAEASEGPEKVGV